MEVRLISQMPTKGTYSFLNFFTLGEILKSEPSLLESIDGYGLDGIAIVWLLKHLGVPNVKRLSFDHTSLALEAFTVYSGKEKKVALVGSRESEIVLAVQRIQATYPELNVDLWRNGFFSSLDERAEFIEELLLRDVSLVVCGMGARRQEEFLVDLRESGFDGLAFSCGGYFHQIASSGLVFYPVWADRLHLRWLFRIFMEPKLLYRYALAYPYYSLMLCSKLLSKEISFVSVERQG